MGYRQRYRAQHLLRRTVLPPTFTQRNTAAQSGGKFTGSQPFSLYTRIRADYLFTGHELLGSDQALVLGPDGRVQAVIPASEAGEELQTFSGLLCPGFINAHCHLELSHLQGIIPEKTGLVDFVLQLMRQRFQDPARIREAISRAEAAMREAGIVAVGDICNTADTLPQKATGQMRYHNFVEASGFVPAGAAARFAAALALYRQFAEQFPASSLVPHAPYSVCQPLLGMINELAHPVITFHNQEVPAENEFFTSGTGDMLRLYRELGIDLSGFQPPGTRSLPAFLPALNRFESLILVHNVCTAQQDLALIEQLGNREPETRHEASASSHPLISLCLCPNANRYISGALPDLPLLMQSGQHLVLGTDSLASNHQLSILEEMKTLQRHFPEIPTATLLTWATLNGARALQADGELGSFEAGKQPGVLLIRNLVAGRFSEDSQVVRLV